jgi:hypothetical protein
MIKYIIPVILWIRLFWVSSTYAADQVTVSILPLLQSTNSVILNDCNLPLIDIDLLYDRLGTNASNRFWTALDVATAYNWTISSLECWGRWALINANRPAYLIDNLCTVAIAKLQWTAEGLWLQSYPLAIELRKFIYGSGTDPDGIMPQISWLTFSSLRGQWIPTLAASSDLSNCGQIITGPWDGLNAIYQQIIGSIDNITSDCNDVDRYKVAAYLNGDNTRVRWFNQGNSNRDAALARCQARISSLQEQQIKAVENISIMWWYKYISSINKARKNGIDTQNAVVAQNESESASLLGDAYKQTPNTKVCAA